MMNRRNMVLASGAAALAAGAAWYGAAGRAPSYEDVVQEVWRHRTVDEAGELAYLVHYATLAANSHNTQPWRFGVSGNVFTLRPDLTRATPAADPDFHHLYSSLGCAAENFGLAAGAIGKSASVDFDPEGNGQVLIALKPSAAPGDRLFDTILERQCTRTVYDGARPAPAEIAQLRDAAKVKGARVEIIEQGPVVEQILELSLTANARQINQKPFRRELKTWLRFNGAHAAEMRDGLYGASTGNPPVPSFIGNMLFDFAFTAKAENNRLAEQVRSSAGLAVFISEKDDKPHWVQAGRSYQRFALQAAAIGLRHAFVNQPVDVPEMRAELSKLLELGNGRPDLVVRFGYGKAMPKSLRRPVEEVMT